MFGFRLTRTQYKALNERVGARKKPRKKTTSKRKIPTWSVVIGGRERTFKEWTKSEVRARVKELVGHSLPVGLDIERVGQ